MRITRVYTRTGDKGMTGLADGTRLPKNHPRIAAYGSVDELNAVVGLTRTWSRSGPGSFPERIDPILDRVQQDLFDLGADLATPSGVEGALRIPDEATQELEGWIDELNATLPPLEEFILPGGGAVVAHLHQARTVCRRAERDVVTLMDGDAEVGGDPLRYLNRLSDLLFVLSRWSARQLREPELTWKPGRRG